jgi:hypothetical protein
LQITPNGLRFEESEGTGTPQVGRRFELGQQGAISFVG